MTHPIHSSASCSLSSGGNNSQSSSNSSSSSKSSSVSELSLKQKLADENFGKITRGVTFQALRANNNNNRTSRVASNSINSNPVEWMLASLI